MERPSPSLSSVSEAPQADSTRDVASDQMLTSEISGDSLSDSHHGRDSDVVRTRPRQSETEWAPSNMSEESVELGREIASSLSTKSAMDRKNYAKGAPLRVVDEGDHYASVDVTNDGPELLEPAELLQETPSQLTFRVSWNASLESSRPSSFFPFYALICRNGIQTSSSPTLRHQGHHRSRMRQEFMQACHLPRLR